jgi:large subunit ribosomal protein L1
MSPSKRFKAALGKVDAAKEYSVQEAVEKVKAAAGAKFVESVDIAVRLGVDPKKADQAIRGTVSLPTRGPRSGAYKTAEGRRSQSGRS